MTDSKSSLKSTSTLDRLREWIALLRLSLADAGNRDFSDLTGLLSSRTTQSAQKSLGRPLTACKVIEIGYGARPDRLICSSGKAWTSRDRPGSTHPAWHSGGVPAPLSKERLGARDQLGCPLVHRTRDSCAVPCLRNSPGNAGDGATSPVNVLPWATPQDQDLWCPASRANSIFRRMSSSIFLPAPWSPPSHHGRQHGPRWRGLCQTDGLHRHLRRPSPRAASRHLESAHGLPPSPGALRRYRHPANPISTNSASQTIANSSPGTSTSSRRPAFDPV